MKFLKTVTVFFKFPQGYIAIALNFINYNKNNTGLINWDTYKGQGKSASKFSKKKGLAHSFDLKNFKRPTLILSLGGYIIFGTGLSSILWFVVVLNTISLSMWSKYPNSIHEKKPPWTIRKNFGYVSKNIWLNFCQIFQVSVKKSKHLELSRFM